MFANHYSNLEKEAALKYSKVKGLTTVLFISDDLSCEQSLLYKELRKECLVVSLASKSQYLIPPQTAPCVLFYQIPRDPKYATSIAVVLNSLTANSSLFVIAIDVREEVASITRSVHHWLSFIQCHGFSSREPSLILVGSHLDAAFSEKMESISAALLPHKILSITQAKELIISLVKSSPFRSLSPPASIMLALLEKDFSNVVITSVSVLQSHIEDTGVQLPTDAHSLQSILQELHELGFISKTQKNQFGPTFNLLNFVYNVYQSLFSEQAKLTMKKYGTTAGYISNSVIQKVFRLSNYSMTKNILYQLEYCLKINEREIEKYFFPVLDKGDAVCVTPPHSVGWAMQCNDCLPQHFLHALLIRIIYRFILSPSKFPWLHAMATLFAAAEVESFSDSEVSSDTSSRVFSSYQCMIWKTGVHWVMEEGLECMVELLNNNKEVVVTIKSEQSAAKNCVGVLSTILLCVMEVKAEFCHSITPRFFLLHPADMNTPLNPDYMFDMVSVGKALSCPETREEVLSVSGKRPIDVSKLLQCMQKLTHWHSLFPIDSKSVLHYLEDTVDLHELGRHLNISPEIVKAIVLGFPTDLRRMREELVRAWLSSSVEPPCWWHLMLALRKMQREKLAEDILTRYGRDIALQEKLLAPQHQFEEPDRRFQTVFADMMRLSNDVYDLDDFMMDECNIIEVDTYGQLYRSIPLFPLETFSLPSDFDVSQPLFLTEGLELEPVMTQLVTAITQGDTKHVNQMLSDRELNINDLSGREGLSALMIACIYGQYDMAKLLLEHGAKVDLQDHSGWSALMHSVKGGHLDTAKLLLRYGADVDLQSVTWDSALSVALSEEDSAMITIFNEKYIATKGSDVVLKDSDSPAAAQKLISDEPAHNEEDTIQHSKKLVIAEDVSPVSLNFTPDAPLNIRTLVLLRWEGSDSQQHAFKLVSKTSSKWKTFGRLFGREENELEAWEDEYRGKAENCWFRVMSKWLENGGTDEYPATWEGVMKVLNDMECWDVARALETALKSAITPSVNQQDAFSISTVCSPTSHIVCTNQFGLPHQQCGSLLSKPFLRTTGLPQPQFKAALSPQSLLLNLCQIPSSSSPSLLTPVQELD